MKKHKLNWRIPNYSLLWGVNFLHNECIISWNLKRWPLASARRMQADGIGLSSFSAGSWQGRFGSVREPWKGAWEGGSTGKDAKSRFCPVGIRTKDRWGPVENFLHWPFSFLSKVSTFIPVSFGSICACVLDQQYDLGICYRCRGFGPARWPTKSGTLGVEPSHLGFNRASKGLWCMLSLRSTVLRSESHT